MSVVVENLHNNIFGNVILSPEFILKCICVSANTNESVAGAAVGCCRLLGSDKKLCVDIRW
eukprot:SAG11_NODE_1122_length_5788_cov_7.564423_1_plen_60_part_10